MSKPTLYTNECSKRIIDHKKAAVDYRSDFRIDFGRLIHSTCFRRLQGKTQLFPGIESDYFRNRLTHSLEVAQIAKGIAIFLNHENDDLKKNAQEIDYDLVEFAGLAHDLGHPPFGHVGEEALDEKMRKFGGYEGNAQTLRILSKLEKKYIPNQPSFDYPNRGDERWGLNLTYRTLASILKYDSAIAFKRDKSDSVQKGHFYTDVELVKKIKKALSGDENYKNFKTIECSLMDVADDIAYSTYDLDDTLKANFLNLWDIISANGSILERVCEKVNKNMKKAGFSDGYETSNVLSILYRVLQLESYDDTMREDLKTATPISVFARVYEALKTIGSNGFLRTNFTSTLVQRFINGVSLNYNSEAPMLSTVYLNQEIREEVEVLKNFVFISQIESPRLTITAVRGKEIVGEIFDFLDKEKQYKLMPDDYIQLYEAVPEKDSYRKRIICDFIAGMTDRYAVEFYGRLKSENPQTIFKPL